MLDLTVVAIFAAEDLPVAARRFRLDARDGDQRLEPVRVDTEQIRSRRLRRLWTEVGRL